MTDGAQAAVLPDGRLHLHHGPIDLIVTAEGPGRSHAFNLARDRFRTVLEELTPELEDLTRSFEGQEGKTPVARRMSAAVSPLAADRFITPMAAVAGSIADEIRDHLAMADLTKATVNNGGDIAVYLTKGQEVRLASQHGTIAVTTDSPVRGVATSGWRGRSQSLGIADAVTVLAPSAARADAAATLIANAVDLPGHPAIIRRPAGEIEAIPQLGHRLVTTAVGELSDEDISTALDAGARYADHLNSNGLIIGALLTLQGETRVIGSANTATALPAHRS